MKDVKLFHLTNCPYCIHARKAIEELVQENAEYGTIPIQWVEERQEPAVADSYDYYYVPTVFYGTEKLYEADPTQGYTEIKECIRKAFDTILSAY